MLHRAACDVNHYGNYPFDTPCVTGGGFGMYPKGGCSRRGTERTVQGWCSRVIRGLTISSITVRGLWVGVLGHPPSFRVIAVLPGPDVDHENYPVFSEVGQEAKNPNRCRLGFWFRRLTSFTLSRPRHQTFAGSAGVGKPIRVVAFESRVLHPHDARCYTVRLVMSITV